MWLGWILTSCVVLALYDLCKKASVKGNSVFPTLFISTLSGFAAVTATLVFRGGFAAAVDVPKAHVGLLLVKSLIVGASWTSTYFALRTLPITSAAPIRATGPLWTLLGAILVFGEVPTVLQGVGMFLVLVGCRLFSLSAKREGVDVWRDRSIFFAFLGALLGSCSALYDKHLLHEVGIPTGTVLWWFMGGMCVIYGLAALIDHRGFEWRWTIPLVGILLAISDACYFNAVSVPDAKISILSMVRRTSVVIVFFVGGAVFHETNIRRKAFALAAILSGVILLCLR